MVSRNVKMPHFLVILILCGHTSKSLNQVILLPSDSEVNAVSGSNFTFTCTSLIESFLTFEWNVNGTSVTSTELQDTVIMQHDVAAISTLTFYNLALQYNGSQIQCAITDSSGNSQLSNKVMLQLIHGRLSIVGNLTLSLQNDTLIVTWTAPSIIGNIDHNPNFTTYCVEVDSSSSYETLYSECEINVTMFSYPLLPESWCQRISFIVTPQNVETIEGSSVAKSFVGAQMRPEVQSATLYDGISMSAPVCNAELIFMDVDTGEIITLGDLTITETKITFSTQQLRKNRHYNVTVTASNIAGSATSYTSLSTHGIQNVSIEMGAIVINYASNATASGALVFCDLLERTSSKFTRVAAFTVERNNSLDYTLPLPGLYRLSVFDIEQDGTILNGVGYPAITKTVQYNISSSNMPATSCPVEESDCSLYCIEGVTFYSIVADCLYFDSSIDGYQIIAQLSSNSHIVHSNTSLRPFLPTVLVPEEGMYYITVLSIKKGIGVINSSIYFELVKVCDLPTTKTTLQDESPHSTEDAHYGNTLTVLMASTISAVTLGVAAIILTTLSVGMVLWCKKKKKRHHLMPTIKSERYSKQHGNEAGNSNHQMSLKDINIDHLDTKNSSTKKKSKGTSCDSSTAMSEHSASSSSQAQIYNIVFEIHANNYTLEIDPTKDKEAAES